MGNTQSRVKKIEKFMLTTLIWNAALSVLKLVTGIIGASFALVSDAINSISDIFASLIGILGIRLSGKKADKEHPYGHERFESLFAIGLAAIILFTAVEVIKSNITTLVNYFSGNIVLDTPNIWAIVGASIALIIKLFIYFKTKQMAREQKSPILKADALNHFGDIFSTLGGLAAIVGSMFGAPYLDYFGSIIIALFIIRVAVGIVLGSINQLVDEAADDETIANIKKSVLLHIKEEQMDVLKTRQHGVRCYVDLEISLPKNVTLECAHAIAEEIASDIKLHNPLVKRTMVHVNPME